MLVLTSPGGPVDNFPEIQHWLPKYITVERTYGAKKPQCAQTVDCAQFTHEKLQCMGVYEVYVERPGQIYDSS